MSDGRKQTSGDEREALPESGRRGVSLPSNRSFVVQFRAEGAADEVFSGRFEHVATGHVGSFGSRSELVEGLDNALREIAKARRSLPFHDTLPNENED